MTKLIGPFLFILEGEPRMSASSSEFTDRVRIVVYAMSADAFNEISFSFECADSERVIRAVRAFNDEMQRVETREAAE